MRLIALFLSLFTARLMAADAWPRIPYTEVRAYAWPDDKMTDAVILQGGVLKPGVINKEGAVLSPEQINRLLLAVTVKQQPYPVAFCHIPHNAFVFYNAAKRPVAFVEICFGCFRNRIFPRGAVEFPDLISLATLFEELKLPMGAYADLESFKKHMGVK